VGAAVTATNRLGGHLSARRHIYLFPERTRAEWAVVDTRDAWLVRELKADVPRFRRLVLQLDGDPAWRKVFDRGEVRVYRRLTPPSRD
jgi:hypothetical protein